MLRKHSQTFLLLFKFADLTILIVSFLAAYYYVFGSLTFMFHYLFLLFLLTALWFSVSSLLKYYETHRIKTIYHDIRLLVKTNLIILFIVSLPLFYLQNSPYSFSRQFILIYFGTAFCACLVLRVTVRILLRYIRKKGYNTRRLLIIGGGHLARMILDRVNRHPEFGYKDPVVIADAVEHEDLRLLLKGGVDDLEQVIREHAVDDVIVAYPLSKEREVFAIVGRCEMIGVRVRIAPDFFRLIHNRAVIEDFDNLPLIGLRPEPLITLWNRFIKRSFDIVFSLCLLLFLSPLLLCIAIAIKLTSKGPVLFVQERIGGNNKPFNIYKFRTMRVQEKEKSDTVWTSRDDARVTPLGKLLRTTSLDELPQFFNVLTGRMSVVGPRPEREYFADKFAEAIRAYRIRHLVRVGITGWAQVNGLRGDTSISERVKYDLYYLENWSFWFDIKIILMTLFGRQKNAM